MYTHIFLLPSKPTSKLHELPPQPGVYYVTGFWLLFYVGQAKNLRKRWNKRHQRYNQLRVLGPFGRVHYRVMPAQRVVAYEKSEIQKLQPPWNYSPVPDVWGLFWYFLSVWIRIVFYTVLFLLAIACLIYLILSA